jgi:hypothetical protein
VVEVMNNIYDIVSVSAQITGNTLIKELKTNNMLQLEETAYEKTKEEVHNFKKALEILSNEQVPKDFKREIALYSTHMQNALKWLKDHVSEQEFILFYQFNFNKQSQRELAIVHKIDEKTVRRARNRCLSTLSVFLHPELFIDEILD